MIIVLGDVRLFGEISKNQPFSGQLGPDWKIIWV